MHVIFRGRFMKRLSLLLDDDLYRRICALASRGRTSVAEIIRRSLREGLGEGSGSSAPCPPPGPGEDGPGSFP